MLVGKVDDAPGKPSFTVPPLLNRLNPFAPEEVLYEQYWKPVWGALEQYWKPTGQKREGTGPMSGTLHLAQAQSNRGPRGRKKDFPDAERLVKRLVANELSLSFVPDAEQRLWRTAMRRKYQLTRNRVQLQNRLEALLEEAHIKLSSLVSDLLGASARRMLVERDANSGPSLLVEKDFQCLHSDERNPSDDADSFPNRSADDQGK